MGTFAFSGEAGVKNLRTTTSGPMKNPRQLKLILGGALPSEKILREGASPGKRTGDQNNRSRERKTPEEKGASSPECRNV